jgi:hypothetical protein
MEGFPDNMFGLGTDITLTWNYDLSVGSQTSVSLSHLNNEFVLNSGADGYLAQLGIDRVERDNTIPAPEDHPLGSLLIKGVAFGVKYQYALALGQLSDSKFNTIQNMVAAQHKTGKLIRLDDKILRFTEYGAQTRAIAPGTDAPVTTAGWVSYYASFLVWIPSFSRKLYQGNGRGRLEFTAIEYDAPLSP